MAAAPPPPVGVPPPTPSEQPKDVRGELQQALSTFITTFKGARPNPSDMESAIINLDNRAQAALKTRGT